MDEHLSSLNSSLLFVNANYGENFLWSQVLYLIAKKTHSRETSNFQYNVHLALM